MASIQHIGKGALRVAKNYTKGYSDTQSKVRDATSNDPWGPSGTQMNEIAQLTYNQCVLVLSVRCCMYLLMDLTGAEEMILWRSWRCWTSG